MDFEKTMNETRIFILEAVLSAAGGDIGKSARALKITKTQLRGEMKKLKIPLSEKTAPKPRSHELSFQYGWRDHKKEIILAALRKHHGNRSHAAKELGISLRTLRYHIKYYQESGIEVPPPERFQA